MADTVGPQDITVAVRVARQQGQACTVVVGNPDMSNEFGLIIVQNIVGLFRQYFGKEWPMVMTFDIYLMAVRGVAEYIIVVAQECAWLARKRIETQNFAIFVRTVADMGDFYAIRTLKNEYTLIVGCSCGIGYVI
jgi:hypothetical protein